MRILFPLLLITIKCTTACECPTLPPISEKLLENYNVIFWGKVDSVSKNSSKGFKSAHFSVKELYKGNIDEHSTIYYDDSSSCMMSFNTHEEWIIYVNFKTFDHLNVSICEHSRKLFIESENDFYQLAALRTFNDEKLFLKTSLGIIPYANNRERNKKQENFKPHNIQPEPINKLWLLVISLSSMIIVYIVTRNNKNN